MGLTALLTLAFVLVWPPVSHGSALPGIHRVQAEMGHHAHIVRGIVNLYERHTVLLLARRDPYDRYWSLLVFVPVLVLYSPTLSMVVLGFSALIGLIVALLIVLALYVTGALPAHEALAGFGSEPAIAFTRSPMAKCGKPPSVPPWPSVALPPAMTVPSCGAMYWKRSTAFWQASWVVPDAQLLACADIVAGAAAIAASTRYMRERI